MTAPVAGELMLPVGLAKFGWLKTSCAWTSICQANRSVVWKLFISARSMFFIGGPSRILIPAFPNLPTLAGLEQTGVVVGHPGIEKAARLIQLLIVWPPDGITLTPDTTSGRPPGLLVFDVSNPEKLGVKY